MEEDFDFGFSAVDADELENKITPKSDSNLDVLKTAVEQIEDRKKELNELYKIKLKELEKLIVPLINNLMKNPEKEYILWPNRQESLSKHLEKVYKVTRSEDNIL